MVATGKEWLSQGCVYYPGISKCWNELIMNRATSEFFPHNLF